MKVLQIAVVGLVLAINLANAAAPDDTKCGKPSKALENIKAADDKMGKAKEIADKIRKRFEKMEKPGANEPELTETTEATNSRKKREITPDADQKAANDEIMSRLEKMKGNLKNVKEGVDKSKKGLEKVRGRFKGLESMAEKAREMVKKGEGLVKGWLDKAKEGIKGKITGAVSGAMGGKEEEDKTEAQREKREVSTSALETAIGKVSDSDLKEKLNKLIKGEDGAANQDELMDAILEEEDIATELLKLDEVLEKVAEKGAGNKELIESLKADIDGSLECGKEYAKVKAAVRGHSGMLKKVKKGMKEQNEKMKMIKEEAKEKLKEMKKKMEEAKAAAKAGKEADEEAETDEETKARKKRATADNVEGAAEETLAEQEAFETELATNDAESAALESTMEDTLQNALQGGAGSIGAVFGLMVMAVVGAMMAV